MSHCSLVQFHFYSFSSFCNLGVDRTGSIILMHNIYRNAGIFCYENNHFSSITERYIYVIIQTHTNRLKIQFSLLF